MATENHPQALAARARRERLDGLDDSDAGDDPLQDGVGSPASEKNPPLFFVTLMFEYSMNT